MQEVSTENKLCTRQHEGKELFHEVAEKEMLRKTTRQRIDSQGNMRKESKKRKLLQSWKRAVVVSSKVQRPTT